MSCDNGSWRRYCGGEAKFADRKFDVVIAAGGDGTLNEVVNGLVGHEFRPKFGIIPVGTTNDFARAIGVPRSIEEAADIICEGKTVPLDLGRANDTYFINIAGGGRITELTYEVPSKLKTVLGQLAYYLKGIEMLPSLHPTYVEIEYDGKLLQEEITMFLITNTRSVGGFEKVAPYASINDGLFDLLVLKKGSIADLIKRQHKHNVVSILIIQKCYIHKRTELKYIHQIN